MRPSQALPYLLLASLALALPTRAADSKRKPNILIVLADDEGWGDLGVNGNTNVSTPKIDSLAAAGALLEHFYVCPVCSPTRAEFLTGRYHLRGGVHGVSSGEERLNIDEKTIADTFKAAGYATGAFGKWHNGMQYPYHPRGRGFDEYYGFCSGHWGDYFDAPLEHNGLPVQGKGFLIDDLTEHAMDFIEQNKDKPFFCYVPFNTPHFPLQVPDRFFDKFASFDLKMRARNPAQEKVEVTRAILAMTENIDWNVGRLLAHLDKLHLADDTIVIYFSDNGPQSWRWNGEMKGKKGSTDEGGVRAPFLIRWPGHIPAGQRVPQIAGAIDLLPTLADLAQVTLISTKPLDGVSLKPLVLNAAKDWPDRMIFSEWGGRTSVRTQHYRLDAMNALYDMDADLPQDHDVAAQHPEEAARLKQAMAAWRSELLPSGRKDDRPFSVGYPEFPVTQLPARDGMEHGEIRRSSKAPNCSYFTHWVSPNDSITWDVDVATAGKYEAVIYYAVPEADLGSTLELSFLGKSLQGKVTVANDPPLHGAEHDRAPREAESFVKDWKPMTLGQVELAKGRGQLTLRAPQIPGKSALECRAMFLTLKP
ncbi:MAG: arylsulfatase [Chthoniobacter sp.]|uniref:arylsulfatase n=1 Tax=Chthoniobacter sp. TaxID=2510640 RepID=UPI0032A24E11